MQTVARARERATTAESVVARFRRASEHVRKALGSLDRAPNSAHAPLAENVWENADTRRASLRAEFETKFQTEKPYENIPEAIPRVTDRPGRPIRAARIPKR